MTRALTPVAPSTTDPRFTTVVSSSGFSAGDYVYQRPDGTYGPVPNGVSASATFNIDDSLPNPNTDVSTIAGPMQTLDGGSYQAMAAKLSNGNVVVVYRQRASIGALTAQRIIFAILNTSGTVIVGPTETGTILSTGNNGASVTALTGGGFVIHYLDSATTKPTFGIYTNTGTVTTAIATDAAAVAGQSATPLYGCALPNGGFALSYSSTTNCYVRAFNATGTGAYAWTAFAVNTIAACPIAARSDSNVCVFYMTSLTAHSYTVLNTSGGTVTTGSITVTSVSSYNALSVCALADNTFVLAYPATNNSITPRYRILNTSNVLGSEVTVPTSGMITGAGQLKCLYAVALSNGGFIYCFTNADGLMHYVPYNSAGVNQSIGTNVYSFGEIFASDQDLVPGFVERSGFLDIYFYGPFGRSLAPVPYYILRTTLELTNYRVFSSSSTNTLLGTTSLSVNNYARSNSTPTLAAFSPSATSTVTLNSAHAATVVSPFVVDPGYTLSNGFSMTTSPTGEVYIAYKTGSAIIRFIKYSNAGVFIKAVNLGTSNTTAFASLDITTLDDGRIVVADGRTGNTAILYYCDSNLNVITSSTISFTALTSGILAIAGIPGNRLVIIGNSGSDIFYRVFDNAGNTLIAATAFGLTTTSTAGLSVTKTPSGFAARCYATTGTNDRLLIYSATGATAYTAVVTQSFGSTQNFSSLGAIASNNGNLIVAMGSTGTNTQITLQPAGTPIAGTSNSYTVDTTSANLRATLGVTGSGIIVLAACNGVNNGIFLHSFGASITSAVSTSTNITDYQSNAYPRIASLPGNNIALAYVNTSGQLAMGFYNAYPYSSAKTFTANVSPSRPGFNLNPSPSSGYTLIGVAATDCAAGGAGQVQVNGVATVNSQYSASTAYQGFDFQVPGNRGVRGTVAGSTVTLIGDA